MKFYTKVLYKKFEVFSLPVFGGNLSEKDINNINVRRGFSQSDKLIPIVKRSALDSQSKEKLLNDLVVGHCGVVEQDLLSFMFKVQRYRDARLTYIEIDKLSETTDNLIKKLFKDADTDYICLTETISREDQCEKLRGRGK